MKTLGIYCGGYSSEFEISLKSAKTIQKNFPERYQTALIIVSELKWTVLFHDKEYAFNWERNGFQTEREYVRIDLGLVYIHGNPGENGKVQAYLELKNTPYLNSNVLASSLSFDKWFCNQFLSNFEVPIAKSILLHEIPKNETSILEALGLPVFVKPCDSGSSYGISKVNTEKELIPALEKAFEEGDSVVIESFLKGTEVTCGVYRTANSMESLPLTEIVSENEFFDFEAKYLGKSQEITPARILEEEAKLTSELAKKIYRILQLKSIARIDFILVEGIPHLIEVNTTPGFSEASIVPKMLACANKSITEFWEEILESQGF